MLPLLISGLIIMGSIAVLSTWMLFVQLKKIRLAAAEDLEIEQTINYFSTSLIGHHTIEDILWDVTKNCISRLNFEDCVTYLLNEQRQVLVQKAAFGPKNPGNYEIFQPIEIPVGKGIVGTVAQTGMAEIIPDTSKDARYIIDDQARLSEIAVPIIYQGRVIGVIDSEHHARNFFTSKHMRILTTIAALCAGKVNQHKLEQAYRQAEISLIENNRLLAENRLSFLRMQMNPRFIFSSIQSIDNYIVGDKSVNASRYLSKFSSLLHHVFDNTTADWVTLASEIDAIELYVQLEKFRYADKFEVSFFVSEDIDPASVLVPPMMLMPFIENAIWHGLLTKKGHGQLAIRYWLGDEVLYIGIEDNGIGRSASADLKQGAASNAQGLSNTAERVKIMNELFNAGITYNITDLYDDGGEPAGTIVSVALKLKRTEIAGQESMSA